MNAAGGSDSGSGSGSASLFDALTGLQIAKLLHNDGPGFDGFGESVDIDGNIAIVGADHYNNGGTTSGTAYVFDVLSGAQIAKLLPSDGATRDKFGISVSISGSTVIVGAQLDDDNGTNSGSAYLFEALTGVQIAKLLPSDGAAGDIFGVSVSIDGAYAVVSAAGHDDNGPQSGSAYVFDVLSGAQTVELLGGDGLADDNLGQSVAIGGTTVIAGASADEDNGDLSGSAYLSGIPALARTTTRNGSGQNAVLLTMVADAVLGSSFVVDLDCSGHSPSKGVLKFYAGASSGFFLNGGELLVDLSSSFLASIPQAHTGGVIQFSLPVPNDPSLCGLPASVQGVVLGAPGYALSNALELVVGV